MENRYDIIEDQEEKYKMVISASKGDIRFEEIKSWIQSRIKNKNDS